MREKWESYSSKTSFRRDFSGSVLFKGHIFDLNHYYRHLYQMVKIVANYNESIVEKKEKRKYLRMLRAQLTRIEQLMLFFNWFSFFSGWIYPRFFLEFECFYYSWLNIYPFINVK